MLQILGWMGCVYLIAKGIELVINPHHREAAKREGEDWHRIKPSALYTGWALWVLAVIFFFLINYQASRTPGAAPSYPSFSECLQAAKTVDEMTACSRNR